METILITLTLIIPHPSDALQWMMEDVPNQIQVRHDGIEVSYPYKVNDCRTLKPLANEHVFQYSNSNICYVIDTREPFLFRNGNQWMSITGKSYRRCSSP